MGSWNLWLHKEITDKLEKQISNFDELEHDKCLMIYQHGPSYGYRKT